MKANDKCISLYLYGFINNVIKMNRRIRRALDYIQLPNTLLVIYRLNKTELVYAKNRLDLVKGTYRGDSVPLKIARWFANVL